MKLIAQILLLLILIGKAPGQDPDAERILARYQSIRPTAKDLVMYQLDWTESLDVALKRAAKEQRPVCLIVIHAKYGDITSGHC